MYTLTALSIYGEKLCEITTKYLSDAIKCLKMNLDCYELYLKDSTTGEELFNQHTGKVLYNVFDFSNKEEG